MTVGLSDINTDDDDPLSIVLAISNGSKSANETNSLHKTANNVLLMITKMRNGIYNRVTLKMPCAMYYSADNYNNNNSLYDSSNNGTQLLYRPTTTGMTKRADSPHTNTVMYDEPNLEVINRSLLLTTAVSATATPASGNNNTSPLQTVFMVNTTYNITTANENADEEWARFYDLMLSWQGICLIAVFSTFIVVTIIGNTLVILAVITTRRLKTVTNCFVMSLAIADLLVGIFVMPPAVAVHLIGESNYEEWELNEVPCLLYQNLWALL